MSLAEALHKTLGELDGLVDENELMLWAAWSDRKRPPQSEM